jgi:GNAT superfamily N-acetyltransferase
MPASSTRAITSGDLDQVAAIDKAITGQSRRHFFEKRFATAKQRPSEFVQVGVYEDESLRGFAIAHVLRGEFGQKDAVAVLDALGVAPGDRAHGLGPSLMDGLIAAAREHGATSIQSQVDWKNADLLRFFNHAGFELAPRLALERAAGDLPEPVEGEP